MNKHDYALLRNKKKRNQHRQKQVTHNQKLVIKEQANDRQYQDS